MHFNKASFLTCFTFLVFAFSSVDSYSQDLPEKWSVGLNYHGSSEMSDPGTKNYSGLNLSVERAISKHFTVGISGSYFVPNDIRHDAPFVNVEYKRKAGNVGVFLIGDIVQFSRFNLYGKTGIDYRIESQNGFFEMTNDVGPIQTETKQIDRTEKKTGYSLGLGLEVKYKAVFFIEPSLSVFDTNFMHVRTGIKIPF